MKPWRLQTDQDGRGRSAESRSRNRSRPGVETLEGRALLSTITAVPTSTPQRSSTQPAAYRPSTQQQQEFPPYDINPTVESPTDGGGTNNVFEGNVEVGGNTFPYSTVWLADGLKPGYFTNVAQANSKGQYAFVVPVGFGTTTLQVFAENSVQDYSNIDTVTVTRGNPIEAWDSIALHAIEVQDLPAPEAARDLAILHAAQYDAVASVIDPSSAYQVHISAAKGTKAEAAADSSAYTALTSLFPAQAALFVAAEESALAGLPNTTPTKNGLAVGQQVADQTLANRANDGSDATATLTPSAVPGLWQPTPPSYSAAVDPQFAKVTPFEIASSSSFRPATPPAVGSAAYDQALSQVSSLGRVGSTTRTADQTDAALFWNEGEASVSDPAHWNAIAEQVSVSRKDSLVTDARLFAQLDFALADAAIASTDSQVTFDEWRPITAVQQVDPTFQPLLATPASPSYVSDNAAYGAAAAKVLTSAFGASYKFTDNSETALGLTRSFTSFDAAATEDGNSRVWGGVNFSFDVQAGASLGAQVGQAVLAGFPKAK
jgi:hypothetical protein